MTNKDLRAEYQKETGEYTPDPKDFMNDLLDDQEQYDLIKYLLWLEEEYLQLRNQLGINERAKNKIKNMNNGL